MTRSALVALLVGCLAWTGCGDDDGGDAATTTRAATAPATTAPATTAPPTTAPATTAPATTAPATTTQPAVWPAPDVVFTNPEDAAADFVSEVLGVPPVLGPFQQGDARSGEIEVWWAGEDGMQPPVTRGLLFLRQLGPFDGWFVLAAVSDRVTIVAPESASVVAAGPLTVEGTAVGHEGNVVVTAFPAGRVDAALDQRLTTGAAMDPPAPFVVELDLSEATPPGVVAILVSGGSGAESDPGEFAALPVVIAS